MRILFLCQYYPPDLTNTATLLGQLGEDLASYGHEVWVIAGKPSYNANVAATSTPEGVHVVRTRSTGFDRVALIGRASNYLSFFIGAILCARKVPRPDVIVIFTDPPFIGAAGVLVAGYHRAPFVQVHYDIYPDVAVALGRLNNRTLVALWRRLNGWVRPKAAMNVAIGRDMRENLLADGVRPDRITIIPNWAEPNGQPLHRLDELRYELGWDGLFVVLHAGNVGLGHNLDAFLRAADRLQDVEGLRLAIMGDGAAKPDLLARTAALGLTNVEFLPYQPRDRALEIIAAADCHFVSLAPGLTGWIVPSKVYGIMAAARPFVAAVESRSEVGLLVEEFSCGLRVEPDDDRSIAEALRAMRGSDAAGMGSNARQAFEARYQRHQITRNYEAVLTSVVRSSIAGH